MVVVDSLLNQIETAEIWTYKKLAYRSLTQAILTQPILEISSISAKLLVNLAKVDLSEKLEILSTCWHISCIQSTEPVIICWKNALLDQAKPIRNLAWSFSSRFCTLMPELLPVLWNSLQHFEQDIDDWIRNPSINELLQQRRLEVQPFQMQEKIFQAMLRNTKDPMVVRSIESLVTTMDIDNCLKIMNCLDDSLQSYPISIIFAVARVFLQIAKQVSEQTSLGRDIIARLKNPLMTVFQVCNDPEFIRFICQALYEIQQDCGIFTETDLRKHMFLLDHDPNRRNFNIRIIIDNVGDNSKQALQFYQVMRYSLTLKSGLKIDEPLINSILKFCKVNPKLRPDVLHWIVQLLKERSTTMENVVLTYALSTWIRSYPEDSHPLHLKLSESRILDQLSSLSYCEFILELYEANHELALESLKDLEILCQRFTHQNMVINCPKHSLLKIRLACLLENLWCFLSPEEVTKKQYLEHCLCILSQHSTAAGDAESVIVVENLKAIIPSSI